MRAAIYARVSTADQVEGTSLDNQRQRCTEEIERRGWTLIEEFVDGGVSGSKRSRPALDRLIDAARAREIDAIVVTKLDRFGRSLRHLAPTLGELDDIGVVLVSLSENIDSSTVAGRAMRGILGVFAEMEREVIAQRGVEGQRVKAVQGRWPGGSPPYGYRLEGQARDARVVPDEGERHTLNVAIDAILGGKTTGQTATLLNSMGLYQRAGRPWTHQRLRFTLVAETLKGRAVWGKPGRGNPHSTKLDRDGKPKYGNPIEIQLDDPVLDEDRWDALQRALQARGYGKKADAKPYPNSGATTACGGRLGGVYRADRDLRQYRCTNSKWSATGQPRCDCARIDADWLDTLVWGEIVKVLSDPNRLMRLAEEYQPTEVANQPADLPTIESRITTLVRARTDRATEALKAGVPGDVIAAAIQQIDKEIDALTAYADHVRAYQSRRAEVRDVARLAAEAAERLPLLPLAQQREVLRLLRVSVTLLDPSVTPRVRLAGLVPSGSGPVPGGQQSSAGKGIVSNPFGWFNGGNPENAGPRPHSPRVTIPFRFIA